MWAGVVGLGLLHSFQSLHNSQHIVTKTNQNILNTITLEQVQFDMSQYI